MPFNWCGTVLVVCLARMLWEDGALRILTVYGDNIVEAERALALIGEAVKCSEPQLLPSDPFTPVWAVDGELGPMEVRLLPGHAAWGVDLPAELTAQGAPLREASDAIVCELSADGIETAMVALEFCSALPAGNQAWQRHGRALSCAYVGLPYLIWTETGGQELNAKRGAKAGRRPNPIIPASFVAATRTFDSPCLPVYVPSPSMGADEKAAFRGYFGEQIGILLIRALLEGQEPEPLVEQLIDKNIDLAIALAGMRISNDTLKGEQWTDYLSSDNEFDRLGYLNTPNVASPWKKAITIPIAQAVREFKDRLEAGTAVSAGANNLPICVVPRERAADLAEDLAACWPGVPPEVQEAVDRSQPIVIVWIAGFKPQGDDSRPDRGLLPLARMLFGPVCTVLTVVYGPAPSAARLLLEKSPEALARSNGLWEAVVNLSDIIVTQTATSEALWVLAPETAPHDVTTNAPVEFVVREEPHSYGEQDVDSVVHTLAQACEAELVFEGLCNPPGGDWSGISLRADDGASEYRWTSLPRVGDVSLKRPDHVIQWLSPDPPMIVAIESKDRLPKLEVNVGPRLTGYVATLLKYLPNIVREEQGEWTPCDSFDIHSPRLVSGAAVIWSRTTQMADVISRGNVDLAIALEFPSSGQHKTIVHVAARTSDAQEFAHMLARGASSLNGRVEVQIH